MIKRILTITLISFLVVGCNEPRPEPKFHYGETVKFKEGFYKNSNGIVVGLTGWDFDKNVYYYIIEFGSVHNHVVLSESVMELVEK